jgi:hypothetical protein
MSSSTKIDLYKDFAAGVHLSEAHNSLPPPLYTVCVFTVHLFTQGRGVVGESLTRDKGKGATVHNAGSKIPISTVFKL